ncbi:MAG: hypothetical protein K6T83_20060 [Alicyclobacillus sp.]|nr:hypothetical protein [Alicyclobacillus sp.]
MYPKERQRVLLARAWMAKPELLILDEPCTGLDLSARERLLSAIQSLAEKDGGPTLIYVTHHAEEVMPAFTHVMLLKEGRVLQAGKKADVLTDANVSAAFDVAVEVMWRKDRPWITVR